MWEAKASIQIEFSSENRAIIVLNALKPETKESPTQRARVDVKRDGQKLTLLFEAKDTTALRASINSYTRWIKMINDFLESIFQ